MYDPVSATQRPETLKYAMAFLAVGVGFFLGELLKNGMLGVAGRLMLCLATQQAYRVSISMFCV